MKCGVYMKELKQKDSKHNIKDWIITIFLFIIVFLFVRTFIGQPVMTNGESMSPTLVHGDRIFVEKLSYLFNEPKRGDIIVFPYPADPSKEYIKRIIGMPGDIIDLRNNQFYVNDERIDDPFEVDVVPLGDVQFPITVGEDKYFVLGDNRIVSHDSRHSEVGLIDKGDILGKASFVFYPFSRIRLIK